MRKLFFKIIPLGVLFVVVLSPFDQGGEINILPLLIAIILLIIFRSAGGITKVIKSEKMEALALNESELKKWKKVKPVIGFLYYISVFFTLLGVLSTIASLFIIKDNAFLNLAAKITGLAAGGTVLGWLALFIFNRPGITPDGAM